MENKFAENLSQLRKEKGLSQRQLAEAMGVIARTVSYWETGGQECNLDMLIKLAKFFEVTTDYLLGVDEY